MKPSEDHKVKGREGRVGRIAVKDFIVKGILTGALLAATCCTPCYGFEFLGNYSYLVEFIKLDDKEEPLCVFSDFENYFDEDCHGANLGYFSDQPDLMRRIRKDLGDGEIRWRLGALKGRLLFVPEIREAYATEFENYCNDVIDYVLNKTDLCNPYHKIVTLHHERPEIPESGVTAFLVHNIAKEFTARYIFSNKGHKKVRIDLRGIVFVGEVGSYTTKISLQGNGKVEFIRDTYSIWQNSAKNPYTALTVPVEETLHIGLRKHTERAIGEQAKIDSVKSIKGVESIAEDWIAVEEAIVGGMVHALMPFFIRRCVPNLPYSLIQEDTESKGELKQYRHLRKGIEIVKTIGYKRALKMYSNDPMEFKKLLMQPFPKITSTKGDF